MTRRGGVPTIRSQPMGQIKLHREFASKVEGFPRTCRIYTPDEYEQDPERTFPVLYMHDGQNIFAHPQSALIDTWCANLTVEKLVAERCIEPWIIVGIDSGMGRLEEYSGWDDETHQTKGRGEQYTRFIVNELKPWVDRTYRTRKEPRWTGVAGSSLGGLISLYMGQTKPDVFGRIGAFSPTVMWAKRAVFMQWNQHAKNRTRLYIDAGLAESLNIENREFDYGNEVRRFFEHVKRLGYDDHEVFFVLEPGGHHHETDWARRLPLAFRWLLS